jgi:hypothetical protein
MNYRVTLAFLAALAVIAAVVLGLDRFNIGPSPTANATATSVAGENLQIVRFDDSRVTELDMRQGEREVRAVKNGDMWIIAATNEPANRSTLNSLIIRLSQLRGTRRVDNPGALSEYGLASPPLVIAASLDDGSRHEVEIGDKTPTQSGRYARKSETGDVFVIADQFATDLERLIADPKEPPAPTPRPAVPPLPAGTPTP